MSLDWKVDQIANYKVVCWKEKDNGKFDLNKKTDLLIWGTMKVDLGTIRDKNIDDWLRRIEVCKMFDRPFGDEFYDDEDGNHKCRPWYPDRELLELHRGLVTNVSAKTFKMWYKTTCENMLDEIDRRLAREKADVI